MITLFISLFVFFGSVGSEVLSPDVPTANADVLAVNNSNFNKEDCTCNGIPLKGKVKIVTSYADFEVKVVDSYADMKVKTVSSYPDNCGEWEFVDSYPDFTIKFVDSYPDFTIKFVDSYPGTN